MQEFLQSRVNENVSLKPNFQPQFFKLSEPNAEQDLAHLLAHNPHIQVFDELQSQLEELVKSLNPSTVFSPETLQDAIKLHLQNRSPAHYGVWVYYSWSARLVHIVDEQEFIFLRTSRNQYKITPEERDQLATKKIGVIGLSVGQSVAVTMAMERMFGEIRLADFDRLELTNLNRIRTGIHNLGLSKVTSVAREIMEIDPFLKVICYSDGLSVENMDDFFTKGGKLDLLVEECDGIDIKILCRYKARELQIPVVMETSDRGMLDVERFDLEPNRKILHGLIDHLDMAKLKTLKTSEEKLPYVLPVMGFDSISNRLKASALEVGQSITTWPQLASAVTFGGGLTADVVRRILLNEYKQSGRYYVDLEELVGDSKLIYTPADHKPPVEEALSMEQMQKIADSVSKSKMVGFALSEDTILELVTAANLAPSLANTQPWKWLYHQNRLFLFLDRSRSQSFWDIDDVFGYIGLGAALENLILKVRQKGLDVVISPFPKQQHTELAAIISFVSSDAISTEPSSELDTRLVDQIPVRLSTTQVTHSLIADEKLSELQTALKVIPTVNLQFLDQPTELKEIAEIVAAAERMRFLHPEGHREFFQQHLRWSRAEADMKGDGLILESFHPADRLLLQFIKKPEVAGFLQKWNKGKRLGLSSRHIITQSSALGLLTIQGNTKGDVKESYLRSGQALQRIWLAANAAGIVLQPIQSPLYVFNRYIAQPSSLSVAMRQEIGEMLAGFTKIFKLTDKIQPVFLFRLANADTTKSQSSRRPVRDTLAFSSAPEAASEQFSSKLYL